MKLVKLTQETKQDTAESSAEAQPKQLRGI